MRDYIEAMGGHLRLVAEFFGAGPVEIVAEDLRALVVTEEAAPANGEPRRATKPIDSA